MIDKLEKSQCCGCYSCVSSCLKDAIYMKCDKEGFWYPKIDKDKCINCNLCKTNCPQSAISEDFSVKADKCIGCSFCATVCPKQAWTMKNNNKEIS